VSSLEVPEQQWGRMSQLYRKRIDELTGLPSVVSALVCEYAQNGLTLDDAKHHRAELMRQRKYHVDEQNNEWEREFSLCEH